jgi:hypothetical protein
MMFLINLWFLLLFNVKIMGRQFVDDESVAVCNPLMPIKEVVLLASLSSN